MTTPYRFRPFLIGKKLGMTSFFNQDGEHFSVTAIELSENIITEIKTLKKDGYAAVQLGAKIKKENKLNKPKLGNLKKKDLPALTMLREFRIKPEEEASYKIGEVLDPAKVITINEKVDVTGNSIGKGFQGMVKLYQKKRGLKTHGSKSYRLIGSIGAHTEPGRVLPGKKMPARMGNETVTARNLKVVEFDLENKILLVNGAVPGVEGSMLAIKPSIKKWN